MRIVALEEHYAVPELVSRIPKPLIAKRGCLLRKREAPMAEAPCVIVVVDDRAAPFDAGPYQRTSSIHVIGDLKR
jgi:hypothetical protein